MNIYLDGQLVTLTDEEAAAMFPPPPPLSFPDSQAAQSVAVDARRDALIAQGFTYDFGGSIGPKVLQTRNVTDITNWLTSQVSYTAAVAAGQGATVAASFRAADNSTFMVSYSAGLAALLAMAAHGAAIYANSWSLKDKITAAADHAALDAIDITAGWPS